MVDTKTTGTDMVTEYDRWSERTIVDAIRAARPDDGFLGEEGTIAYEPAAGTPVSGDPVIQAVGRNSDAQALLEEMGYGPSNPLKTTMFVWTGGNRHKLLRRYVREARGHHRRAFQSWLG